MTHGRLMHGIRRMHLGSRPAHIPTATRILEYARTRAGHWYPQRQFIAKEIEGQHLTTIRVIHLDTTYDFPEGLFSPEHFESQLGRPIKTQGAAGRGD